MSKSVEVPIEIVPSTGTSASNHADSSGAPPKSSEPVAVPAASSRPVPSSRPASTGAASPSS